MNKQVICEIDGQYFGLDSLYVRSIETGQAEKSLTATPVFCEGIIKFRGEWAPLVDLRILFNLNKTERSDKGQLIYLKTDCGTIGYRVDKVVEIDTIEENEVQTIPIIVSTGKTAYIAGACSHHDRIIVIVDQKKLISEDDMKLIQNSLKAVYEAEEEERRRKEEEEAKRKAEEKKKAETKEKAEENTDDKTEENTKKTEDSTEESKEDEDNPAGD